MRPFKVLRIVALAVCLTTGMLSTATTAMAKKPKLLLSEAEQTELKELLKHVKYEPSGIDGKPTVQVTEANVQIISGTGNEQTLNGEGNLIIGYDETTGYWRKEWLGLGAPEQSGSDNLVIGGEQEYTQAGGLVAGFANSVRGPYDSATGGGYNIASDELDSVSGGYHNWAGSRTEVEACAPWYASVSGGEENYAGGWATSIGGGAYNATPSLGCGSEPATWIGGGLNNRAEAVRASVSGGEENDASGDDSSVSGGYGNKTEAPWASILGGNSIVLNTTYGVSP